MEKPPTFLSLVDAKKKKADAVPTLRTALNEILQSSKAEALDTPVRNLVIASDRGAGDFDYCVLNTDEIPSLIGVMEAVKQYIIATVYIGDDDEYDD